MFGSSEFNKTKIVISVTKYLKMYKKCQAKLSSMK